MNPSETFVVTGEARRASTGELGVRSPQKIPLMIVGTVPCTGFLIALLSLIVDLIYRSWILLPPRTRISSGAPIDALAPG